MALVLIRGENNSKILNAIAIKKIHPPAHIVVISNDYDDYKELNKTVNDARVFKGYYSGKKQSTQMKDYKTHKKTKDAAVNNYN